MFRLLQLFLAFLSGLFGLSKRPARRKRASRPASRGARASTPKKKAGATTTRRRRVPGVAAQARALADVLPSIELPEGTWDPAEAVRVEDERVCVDLHGLSDEDAVAVVEDAFDALERPVLVRLITGHGRDRPDGYSLIRVALVRALEDRDDVVIDELARHQRHARSDDRLGHVDVRVG